MYCKVNISTLNVLFDPVINIILAPLDTCLRRRCLKDYTPCQKRQRSYDKASEKLNDELEVSTILQKIRDIHGMTHYLKMHDHYLKIVV